jgi:hypothetical protein
MNRGNSVNEINCYGLDDQARFPVETSPDRPIYSITKGKKVELSLCLIKHHAMKMYVGVAV